jgi:hypothetical protein
MTFATAAERHRRTPSLVFVGSAVIALSMVSGTSAAAVAEPIGIDEHPLRAAGKAAESVSFVGVLQMRWQDGGAEHAESLLVEAANGSVVLRGGSAVMALPDQRLVQHGGEWDLLWPVPLGGPERPDPGGKYQLSTGPPTQIGGRSTHVVEVRDQGVLLERLSLDMDTGLLLRREQYDGGSEPARSIGFEIVSIGTASAAPHPPAKVVNAAASPVPPGRLPAGVSAPANLPGSYQRLGAYRRSGVTQVLYSDGLYDLSVFQEEGRLDRRDLRGAERVQIGKRAGWHYVWPGGHVVVWEARGFVHTAVSDAPFGQVMSAIRSLPANGGSASFLRKLRQVCRSLVQPLG